MSPIPMPFIVGAGRSGTTLLRLMLDAHPDLAIPPETGFIPAVAALRGTGAALREEVFRTITSAPAWIDFGLEREAFRRALLEVEPFVVSGGLRAFYRSYAKRFGKPRSGDKTPNYVMKLETVESVLPEARFIHLIRDGRDVAVSVRGLWFAPGRDPEAIALDWKRRIETAREQGRRCRHYLEVRYEDLVTDTTEVLQRLCRSIDLSYHPAMEGYHRTSRLRLEEHQDRRDADGRLLITREDRLHNQRFAMRPPDRSRIGRFQTEMTREDRDRFEKAAGGLLRELGYA